ncbi:hypothetical protein BVRB_2g030400 [Beta vulgaris subsp. vulgaris]|uniref:jasmonate-induced protein homolog n=1 Tax=Beta vulgaris subsp. vulgaris TaxID=3555 RepID=UPI0005400A5D|nr:jasmonate-induced protein homolog [Beta vulgaris subsp. vulgaris]KMT18941.1 hypothetical protein BVRB_2g030400 [Beta vulgaris subsp. vulgaris]
MASLQCERKEEEVVGAAHISSEEKASLDEIIKHAEDSYVSEDVVAKHGGHGLCTAGGHDHGLSAEDRMVGGINLGFRIVAIAGGLKNQTKGSLKISDSKKWAGHVVKNFPNPLSNMGAFSFSAMSATGVKAGVAYAGKNRAGVECAWLLAFADTTATKRRIYAECGPKSKFNRIDWAKIEQKLVNAGQLAKASDKATGTSVYATITGSSGKDVVAAAFTG